MRAPSVVAGLDAPRVRAGALIALLGAVLLYALGPYLSGLLRGAAVVVAAACVLLLLPGAWLIAVVVLETPDALRAVQESAALSRIAGVRIGTLDVGARIAEAGGSLLAWASQRAVHLVG